MHVLTATWLTVRCFAEVAASVGVILLAVLGPGGEYTWQRFPPPWHQRVAMGFTAAVALAGLAVYLVYLRRTLLARGAVPPDAVAGWVALAGPVPLLLLAGGFALWISRMRIGW